jgi:hypothetical protein
MPNKNELVIHVKIIAENEEAKAVFAAAAGHPALTWSAEKPKRRGWWWVLNPDLLVARVLKVENSFGHLLVYVPETGWRPVAYCGLHWRWAGPLPEPQEPPPAESPDNATASTEPCLPT